MIGTERTASLCRRLLLMSSAALWLGHGVAAQEDPSSTRYWQRHFERVESMESRADDDDPDAPLPARPDPPERVAMVDLEATVVPATPTPGAAPVTAAARGIDIFVFSVGQADAMLIVGPDPERKSLLVDLGEDRDGDRENFVRVAERILEETGRPHLDYLLVSHYHSDHVGGTNDGIAGLLDWIEPQFTVGTLIDVGSGGSEYMASSRWTYDQFERQVSRWLASSPPVIERRVQPAFGSGQIELGPGVAVEIVAFAGKAHSGDAGAMAAVVGYDADRYNNAPANENDLSIAFELSYGDFELFSAGDLTGYDEADWPFVPLFTPRQFKQGDGSVRHETYTNVESHLVRSWTSRGRESDVEVLRANHHGSSYSSAPALVELLDPEHVLFSTGGGHGHPHESVITRAADTASLFATTRIASSSSAAWKQKGGVLADEIQIEVAPDGKTYRIEGTLQNAFTDNEEAMGLDY